MARYRGDNVAWDDPSSTVSSRVLVDRHKERREGSTKGHQRHQKGSRNKIAGRGRRRRSVGPSLLGRDIVRYTLPALGPAGSVTTAGTGGPEVVSGVLVEVSADLIAGDSETLVLFLQQVANGFVVRGPEDVRGFQHAELLVDRFGGLGRAVVEVRQQGRHKGHSAAALFVPDRRVDLGFRQQKGGLEDPLNPRNPHPADDGFVGLLRSLVTIGM
mmetsp:Transcript_11534/g.27095  ORF Transcript_11534/g.27095 Transcript_11534/m.27095 type:complete len:215 (-) Transcript_11534:1496-2140(-)